MADYYPLIARAIAGLDANAPSETRRALYERARTALIGQLRNVQPPLSEAEITRERLALEEAVRKVEAEAAKRARPEAARPRPDASSSSQAPRRDAPRPGDALRDSVRSARPTNPPPPSPGRERLSQSFDANPSLASEARPTRNLRGEPSPPPRAPMPPPRDVRAPTSRRTDTQMLDEWTQESRAGAPRRSLDEGRPAAPGVRGMRDVVADAEQLGRGNPQAGRPARRAPTAQYDDQNSRDLGGAAADAEAYSYDESLQEAERYQPKQQPDRARVRVGPRDEEEVVVKGGFPVKTAISVVAAIVIIGLAVLFYRQVYPSIRAILKPSSQVADTQKDAAGTRPKITDRVGQPGQQIAPVAQRVVLYDEDPTAPQGKQYVGSVIWRTEAVKVPAGQPPDIGVRADIEIPERKIKMTLSVRRNADASLPASHTAELTFVLPSDFGATVANVPGVLMKSNEQARGTPLAGLAVKVTDGFFLVGLSATEADKARNMQLLKERSWFDIPIVYSNQRRAIIAIEKGAPGERAFNEAFTAWGQ